MEYDAQQSVAYGNAAVVLDEAESPELVHEDVDSRPRGAHHFRYHFLRDFGRVAPTNTLRHLRELIAALDRRVPRVERVGELSIASDAGALQEKALQRIAILEAKARGRCLFVNLADRSDCAEWNSHI